MDDVAKEEEKLLCSSCPFGRRCKAKHPDGFVFEGIYESDLIEVHYCPRQHLKQYGLVLNNPFYWYSKMEMGILPEEGGLLSQANIFVETMLVLEQLVSQTKRANKIKREQQIEQQINNTADHINRW